MSALYLKDYLMIVLFIVNCFFLLNINRYNKKLSTTLVKEFSKDFGTIYKKLEIINLNNEKNNLDLNFLECYVRNYIEKDELEKLDRILGNNEENEYQKIMKGCNNKIVMYKGRIKDLEIDIKEYGLEKSVRLDGVVYRDYVEKYG